MRSKVSAATAAAALAQQLVEVVSGVGKATGSQSLTLGVDHAVVGRLFVKN
ncbi:hypothetical protein [Variovorax sp. GB1P17]|uniref:hypothetical protein n=1 Tax=Variovorax sp. GB1P17 TaxID=3443740 RepID=UPI003F47EAED